MPAPGGVPPELHARAQSWRAAEDLLYPLAVTDTDAYQQAVQLVGMLRPHFEDRAPGLGDLADAADQARAVLSSLAARAGISLVGIDSDAVVGCAAAARLRELLAQDTFGSEERAISAAREAGLSWAVVAEPDLTIAGLGVPQQWIEVHVESGARLIRGIAMDQRTGEPLFTIDIVAPGETRSSMRLEMEDRAEWLEESDQIRVTFEHWGAP